MDDADGVRRREPAADLASDGDPGDQRELALAVEQVAELLALEQLGDDAGPPVLGAHHVDDVEHVLADDPRDRLRLALEARDRLGVAGELLVHDLDGEPARQAHVLGLVL